MTNDEYWDEVNKYQVHPTRYDVWDRALIITGTDTESLSRPGICKACFRFAPLWDSECPDCRH